MRRKIHTERSEGSGRSESAVAKSWSKAAAPASCNCRVARSRTRYRSSLSSEIHVSISAADGAGRAAAGKAAFSSATAGGGNDDAIRESTATIQKKRIRLMFGTSRMGRCDMRFNWVLSDYAYVNLTPKCIPGDNPLSMKLAILGTDSDI